MDLQTANHELEALGYLGISFLNLKYRSDEAI